MEPADLLRHACDALERLNITYLVTGSTATVAYDTWAAKLGLRGVWHAVQERAQKP